MMCDTDQADLAETETFMWAFKPRQGPEIEPIAYSKEFHKAYLASSDVGTYKCTGKTEYGSDEKSVLVTLGEKLPSRAAEKFAPLSQPKVKIGLATGAAVAIVAGAIIAAVVMLVYRKRRLGKLAVHRMVGRILDSQ